MLTSYLETEVLFQVRLLEKFQVLEAAGQGSSLTQGCQPRVVLRTCRPLPCDTRVFAVPLLPSVVHSMVICFVLGQQKSIFVALNYSDFKGLA